MPTVYPYIPSLFHQELFDQHAPVEQSADWFVVCGAIAYMFDPIETYVRGPGDGSYPPWGIVLDADNCPEEVLPWLAQFVGVTLPQGLTIAQQRARIKSTDGFRRGSIGAIVGALQEVLTGTQTVLFRERDAAVDTDPNYNGAYGLTVFSRDTETPDVELAFDKIMTQKPGGILLNYQTVPGNTWLDVTTTYATWADVLTAFNTWGGVRRNQPGT